MKKPLIIHPFLFAIFPIFFLYAHNIGQVSFSSTLFPSAVMLGLALLLLLLLSYLVFRDSKKAGVVVSIFLVLFFSYGHVYNIIPDCQIGILMGRHWYLLIVWAELFACGAYFITKTGRNLHNLTNILNVVGAIVVVISVINIVPYELRTTSALHEIKRTKELEINAADSRNTNVLPDIYYVILDTYAASSTLKEAYGFDNHEFTDYLSGKGFYVAFESRANYGSSAQSLASSLNMEYLNYPSKKMGEESNDRRPIYAMLQDYKIWRFLKSKGYRFVHFGSWWEPTRRNKYADVNFGYSLLPEFSWLLYQTTMLLPIDWRLGIDKRLAQWKRVPRKFDKLAEIPNIKEPTFVFAHMLIPHEPFVFDRNGNFLTEEEERKRSEKVNYLDQLVFTNSKVKVLIDHLLSRSKTPPIIILQSDTGPSALPRYKMRILNAYYLPSVDKGVLYPSITPVNSFRLIFNLYFDANFELLPDGS